MNFKDILSRLPRLSVVDPTLDALLEGVVSLNQLLGILTISRIDGMDSDSLVEHLLTLPEGPRGKKSFVSGLTARIRMGIIGPTTLRGEFPAHPLIATSNSYDICFSESFKALLAQSTELVRGLVAIETIRGGTGVLCPLAQWPSQSDGSGIDRLAQTYLRIY